MNNQNMTETKFTPGRWVRKHLTIVGEINSVVIAEVAPPNKMLRGRERAEDLEYCIGNAQVMTAASDMFEALLYIQDCIESGNEIGMGIVNRAIMKARGQL